MPDSIVPMKLTDLFSQCPESVKNYARKLIADGWRIYCVNQSRGRCYGGWKKVITIPKWAVEKDNSKPGYSVWYISHELAHAYEANKWDHGPEFMDWLIRICPPEFVHYELGYKPRNAMAAGIRKPGADDNNLFCL